MIKKKNKIIISTFLSMLVALVAMFSHSINIGYSIDNTKPIKTFEVNGSTEKVSCVYDDAAKSYEYQVALSQGDTLKYNEPIDLNKASEDAVVKLNFIPTVSSVADINIISIVLTDAYDTNNYVRITANYDGARCAYWKVGSNNQPQVGYEAWNNTIHVENQYGAWANTGFCENAESDMTIAEIYFDITQNKFYISDGKNGKTLICDLDDPKFYSTLWKGFTTGEVYASIYIDEYLDNKDKTSIGILSAAGNKLDGYMTVTDATAPTIKVNYGEFSESDFPDGAIGLPYKVFSAQAYDAFDGILSPSVSVYQNYEKANQTKIKIEDGAFMPKQFGLYSIIYDSQDLSGNKTSLKVAVKVQSEAKAIKYKIPENIIKSGVVGERLSIPNLEFYGGYGELRLNTFVKNKESGKFYNLNGLSFIPDKAGKYLVCLSASDALKQKVNYKYEIDISVSDKPVILLGASLPKYLIVGKEYILPSVNGYDYNSGKEVAVSTTYKVGNKEETIKSNSVVINEEGNVVIKYLAEGERGTTIKEFTLKAISVNKKDTPSFIDLTKYFVTSNNVSKSLTENSIKFDSGENGAVEFINNILSVDLSINCKISLGTKFSFKLSDTVKSGCYINVDVEINKSGSEIVVNGVKKFTTKEKFDDFTKIGLKGQKLTIGETAFTLTEFNNGFAFNGFTDNVAKIDYTLQDGGIFEISRINNQIFTELTNLDMIRPEIVLSSTYGGSYDINDIYTVYSVSVGDVLEPTIKSSLTIRASDGSYAKTIDGIEMNAVKVDRNYTIKLEKYGNYVITYNADAPGIWDNKFEYVIKVVDIVAPEITLENIKTAKVKVGDKFNVVKAKVSDNYSKDENVKLDVYLINPSGKLKKLENDFFVANEKGKYTLQYFAYDEAGNIALVNYYIIAK